jgi:hypothetical protein
VYQEQENPEFEDVDIAMDFFDGLDIGCYASFKATIINSITAGLIEQPPTLNDMYVLANQWLKTTGPSPSELASTFATKLDMWE